MSNYIFDLDGTLIDSSDRMYKLFCDLIPDCALTKKEYWDYKRNKINHQLLIDNLYPNRSFKDFNSVWMKEIETPYYLEMDCNYPDTTNVLAKLKKDGNKLFLLTARQSKEALMYELNKLGLLEYFDKIMVTEGVSSKSEVLLDYAKENKDILNKNNIFVSDMGKDIQLGNLYGFKTVGICHGFMSREKLEEYHAHVIIEGLSEIFEIE